MAKYKSFSEMSKSEEKQTRKKIELISNKPIDGFLFRKPFINYDKNGLKHELDYLSEIGILVVLLPIEMMVDYASEKFVDLVANSPNKISDLIESIPIVPKVDISGMEATVVGNLAYVIQNMKGENNLKVVEKTKYILDDIYIQVEDIVKNINKVRYEV